MSNHTFEGRYQYERPVRVVKADSADDQNRSVEINMMRHLMARYRGKALDFADSLRRRDIPIDNSEILT